MSTGIQSVGNRFGAVQQVILVHRWPDAAACQFPQWQYVLARLAQPLHAGSSESLRADDLAGGYCDPAAYREPPFVESVEGG